MQPNLAHELATTPQAWVKAAAGCGKTHLIAKAVASSAGRQLILTHTHAGVHSLRMKLKACGVSRSQAVVSTIASWALRYARSYPHLSGWQYDEPPQDEDWELVYPSAKRLLCSRHIRNVVKQSYDGVYVDEYQDCTTSQHDLILQLASLLPCRVLGDPMQAIYMKMSGDTICWDRDVVGCFSCEVGPLVEPHRWKKTNPALGEWLGRVRTLIKQHSAIDRSTAPAKTDVRWLETTDEKTISKECLAAWKRDGTVAILRQGASRCQHLAKMQKGRYSFMEPVEGADVIKWGDWFTALQPSQFGPFLKERVKECVTTIGPLTEIARAQAHGKRRKWTDDEKHALLDSLDAAAVATSFAARCGHFRSAMQLVESGNLCGKLFRREAWNDFKRALQLCESDSDLALRVAIVKAREQRRHYGLRPPNRVVTRPILVKGLEFDHVVVLDADLYDPIELYVALTRASRSLTVVCKSRLLQPQRRRQRNKHDDGPFLFEGLGSS